MVTEVQVAHDVRVKRIRYEAEDRNGAILLAEKIDADGRPAGALVLQMPGFSIIGRQRFHVSQTMRVCGLPREWVNARTGEVEDQLAVREWHNIRPRGAAWVEFVANNPSFEGIGKATAQAIWNRLGPQVYELLAAKDWQSLVEALPVLGPTKAQALVDGWRAAGQERLVEWLETHRLPRSLCAALTRAYDDEDEIVERLTADPYRLLAFAVSWRRADTIGRGTFGLSDADPRRLHGAVIKALYDLYADGHTAATASMLETAVVGLLGGADLAATALLQTYNDGGFVRAAVDLYQLRGTYVMEREIAADLARRAGAACFSLDQIDPRVDRFIDEFEAAHPNGLTLTAAQRAAVCRAAVSPIALVIGGAGTGKTACLEALHYVVERMSGRDDAVIQMALSGRATKRMRDATGKGAVTIAGFLTRVSQESIDAASHIIVDEASMMDAGSTYRVLRKLSGKTNLVLVGDDFQLPPVGAGKILHVLNEREDMPVTVLDKVWRQAEGNAIRNTASDIRDAKLPKLPEYAGIAAGVSFAPVRADVASGVRDIFRDLGGSGTDADVCVIVPTRRRGPESALAINAAVRSDEPDLGRPIVGKDADGRDRDIGFRIGDRFVCDVNSWDVDLMNGSVGRILRLATPEEIEAGLTWRIEMTEALEEARAARDDRAATGLQARLARHTVPLAVAEVDGSEKLLSERHLRACSWGYALTCHRAQGSEFRRVIIVLNDVVDRSWLYTAVTRAREQAVIVGSDKQLRRAIGRAPRVGDRVVALDQLLDNQRGAHGRQRRAA